MIRHGKIAQARSTTRPPKISSTPTSTLWDQQTIHFSVNAWVTKDIFNSNCKHDCKRLTQMSGPASHNCFFTSFTIASLVITPFSSFNSPDCTSPLLCIRGLIKEDEFISSSVHNLRNIIFLCFWPRRRKLQEMEQLNG